MQKLVNRNRMGTKGFTLMELIVVMAILTVLVLIAAPQFISHTKDAEVTAVAADAKVLSQAVMQYQIKNDNADPVVASTDLAPLAAVTAIRGLLVAPNALPDKPDDAAIIKSITDSVGTDLYPTAVTKIAQLDATKLSEYVKNTKNPIGHYVLVTEGTYKGEVFYLNNLTNSDKKAANGVHVEK